MSEELKFLDDLFSKLKDEYTTTEEIKLSKDLTVEVSVFRGGDVEDLLVKVNNKEINYTEYLYRLFSIIVTSINGTPVSDLSLVSTDGSVVSIQDKLYELAKKYLTTSILNLFEIVVKAILSDLSDLSVNNVESKILSDLKSKIDKTKDQISSTDVS